MTKLKPEWIQGRLVQIYKDYDEGKGGEWIAKWSEDGKPKTYKTFAWSKKDFIVRIQHHEPIKPKPDKRGFVKGY